MKVGGNRNFGFGKQMGYAGHRALAGSYQGHFGTVATHSERWGEFCGWAKDRVGIKDARDVSRETLAAFGDHLAEKVAAGEMSVRYAQNLLSSANVTLEAMRGDQAVRISPSDAVGQRDTVRKDFPNSMDAGRVRACANSLREQGAPHAATVLEVARTLGLREREAAMADYHRFAREADQRGEVNVTEGTKGNRGEYVDRWVPVSESARAVIDRAASLQGCNRNLIPPDQSWAKFNRQLHGHATREVFQQHDLKAYHDARSAYACERYAQITGHAAPCIAGSRTASKEADREAREIISQELGHSRVDVVASYIGSAK